MIELVRSGGAIGIAVTGAQRSGAAAELPTLAEAGVLGYELEQWWGIVVPARTPRHIIDKLNAELNRILGDARDRILYGPRGRRSDTIDA